MVFDDNKRIRDSLEMLFTAHSEFEWIGGYMDASGAPDLIGNYLPDIVLMDVEMPGTNGIEATYHIKNKYPDQVIIMLTGFDDDEKVFDSICAGASGYVLKSQSLSTLVETVQEVHNGKLSITPSIAVKIIDFFLQKNASESVEVINLSADEMEVLKNLSLGNSYTNIAKAGAMTYDAIFTSIQNIYEKIHIKLYHRATTSML
ncbi:MAG: response regulator transcription factor [Chitinophagales bacterium]